MSLDCRNGERILSAGERGGAVKKPRAAWRMLRAHVIWCKGLEEEPLQQQVSTPQITSYCHRCPNLDQLPPLGEVGRAGGGGGGGRGGVCERAREDRRQGVQGAISGGHGTPADSWEHGIPCTATRHSEGTQNANRISVLGTAAPVCGHSSWSSLQAQLLHSIEGPMFNPYRQQETGILCAATEENNLFL